MTAFISCLKQVDEVLVSAPFTTPSSYPVNWNSISEFWGTVVNDDLKTYILPYSLPTVMKKLNLSYERSLSDLVTSIKWKLNYLQGLNFDS